jgi:DNA-binding transcriptional LysR family regulator
VHAAQAAGMTQPAASKLLAELETAVGQALFHRHPRGVQANAMGAVLIRLARMVLSDVRKAAEELTALRAGSQVRLAIGSVLSPAVRLLPQALLQLAQQQPQLAVSVETDTSRPMLQKLLAGQLDVVIGRLLDPEHAQDVNFVPLADEPHALFARLGHPLLQIKSITSANVLEFPWIMPPKASILRERIESIFLQRGHAPPRCSLETTSLPLTMRLLHESDALVALPPEVVAPYDSAQPLSIVPFALNVRMDAFGLINRKNPQSTPQLEILRQVILDAARLAYPNQADR